MTTRSAPVWRSVEERGQTLEKHVGFNLTTPGDGPRDAVVLIGKMTEGIKVSLVVDINPLYIEFDEDATSSSMLIPAGAGYADTNIFIGKKISVMNVSPGQNGQIRGIIWGR